MNAKLEEILQNPIRTILAVRASFDYCENEDDIQEVIKKIPDKFGSFQVIAASQREGYFMIQNVFERDGITKSQIVAHDFYNIEEDLYYE